MTDKDWAKEMAKIDKQLESISDAQLFPEKKGGTTQPASSPSPGGASTAQTAGAPVASPRAGVGVSSMPAILRLLLSVVLGVAILFWPYENRCGVGLAGYLFAVAAVAAGGVWSSIWTWRHRVGRAHALSILLIVWGLVLGATEVLPRIGYARQALTWSCTP